MIFLALAGCGRIRFAEQLRVDDAATRRDSSADGGTIDAQRDARADAARDGDLPDSVPEMDAAEDASSNPDTSPIDASEDASPDVVEDATPDADATTDADATPDADASTGPQPTIAAPADLGYGVVPVASWNGSSYFIAAYTAHGVFGPDGAPLRPWQNWSDGMRSNVAIAPVGDQVAVAWEKAIGAGTYDIAFSRFDRGGSDLTGVVWPTGSAPGGPSSLLNNGSSLAMTYQEVPADLEVWFRTLGFDGDGSATPVRISADGTQSEIAYIPALAQYGIVWRDLRLLYAEIYFARLDAAGAVVGTELRITNHMSDSNWPAVATNGSAYALAYSDSRTGSETLWFARVSSAGAMIGGEVEIDATANARVPTIEADDAGGFGIVYWIDRGEGEVWFIYVDASGTPRAPQLVATAARQPTLVGTGDGFTLFWVTPFNHVWMAHVPTP